MNSHDLLSRVMLGVRKNPLKVLINTFITYTVIWAILEPLISIISSAEQYFSGEIKFFVLVLIGITLGLYRSAIPKEIILQYRNSTIKIIFGDLFLREGIITIPVSRYFFEIEVVPTSLQGKFIQSFLTREEGLKGYETYKKKLSVALQNELYQEIYRDVTQKKEKYYSLGTTAIFESNSKDYILFALTETELKGSIPANNCDISKMWDALEVFWQKARIHSRGKIINIPLIGSGVTGIRLSPSLILELNLLAIANAIEEGGKITTEEIVIVLHPKYLETVNLDNFRSLWRQS